MRPRRRGVAALDKFGAFFIKPARHEAIMKARQERKKGQTGPTK